MHIFYGVDLTNKVVMISCVLIFNILFVTFNIIRYGYGGVGAIGRRKKKSRSENINVIIEMYYGCWWLEALSKAFSCMQTNL